MSTSDISFNHGAIGTAGSRIIKQIPIQKGTIWDAALNPETCSLYLSYSNLLGWRVKHPPDMVLIVDVTGTTGALPIFSSHSGVPYYLHRSLKVRDPFALRINQATKKLYINHTSKGIRCISIFDTTGRRSNHQVGSIQLFQPDQSYWMFALNEKTNSIYVPWSRGKLVKHGYLLKMDASTGLLLDVVRVGKEATCVVYDQWHGRIFVANRRSNSISIIDDASFKAVDAIKIRDPVAIKVNAPRDLLYVLADHVWAAAGAGGVNTMFYVIDIKTGKIVSQRGGNDVSRNGFAVNSKRDKLYLMQSRGQELLVLDADGKRVLNAVKFGKVIGRSKHPALPYDCVLVDSKEDLVFVTDAANGFLDVVEA